MKRGNRFLVIGVAVSAIIHAAVIEMVFLVNRSEAVRRLYEKSAIIPFSVPKPPPVPESPPPSPPPNPKPKPKPPDSPRPAPNSDRPAEPSREEVKEVFGVTRETVVDNPASGIGVRVGNTLAKEMEKEYTPPEEVKQLPPPAEKRPEPPRFSPTPLFKISKMPEVKTKIRPVYPPALRKEEVEGEVLLKVALDRTGAIVKVVVVSSDHPLFSEAALTAVKEWKFSPALLADGTPTDIVIEVPVIFQLEF